MSVDGQQYIIKRSGCVEGYRDYYSGSMKKQCGKCTRWRPGYNQGYHQGRKSHIIMMCFCRECGHEEFVLEDWLKSDKFIETHNDYLSRQSETKARNYERAFQHNWADPLYETVEQAAADLRSGGIEEALIKLNIILDKIAIHKREYLAVEGWNPE